MNILLINHYAGSPQMGMEYRPYYLAKEWIKRGHNVTILLANQSHIRQYNPELPHDFFEENIDGIKYIWVKTPKYAGNGIARVKNIFAFSLKIYRKAKYLATLIKPNVVIASSTYPSDNYAAHKIAKIAKAKHAFEVHDLWPLSPMELGNMSKYHPFIMAMQHGENFAYKHTDLLISMLPKTKEHMQQRGLDLKKWHHIPNGINVEEWKNAQPLDSEIDNKLKELKGKLIIGYAGGHAISNSLDTTIEAARILSENPKYVFVFVGAGVEKNRLIKQAENLKNIYFFDSIPKNQIPNLLKKMNYLILAWKKENLYRFGISPNKIFDYMMAEKPIIQAIEAGNDMIKEAECGISVEPENPQAIVQAIEILNQKSQDELSKMGQNGKTYVLKNHDYSKLAQKMLSVFFE